MIRKVMWFVITTIVLINTLPAQATLIRSFEDVATNGANPQGSLINDGTTIYGMTGNGGSSSLGTIFKIETDGSGFLLLHSFAGGAADGSRPRGALILDGTTLYGMTEYGGSSDLGTIFSVETNGTGFSVLHSFTGGAADGSRPWGSLILDGTTLYGMTWQGGDDNKGIIFKIETNGTGFSVMHLFSGNLGANPTDTFIKEGTTLYGMTYNGGFYYDGTIFKIEMDGSGFSVLYHLDNMINTDGTWPYGSLILDGTTFYGMAYMGGPNSLGTIFKVETDGTGFTVLHSFTGSATDGSHPWSSLIQDGTTLYGTTTDGGSGSEGTIFKIETDGSGFFVGHHFAGGTADGDNPIGSLLQIGTTFYGMTNTGGSDDDGTIYKIEESSLPVELTSFTANAIFSGVELKWTTESEIENLGFILERRIEDTDWQGITSYKSDFELEGQGSTSSATDYEYLDVLVQTGITYEYRLSDVDYNGVVTNLAVRRVTVEQSPLPSVIDKFTVLPVYPNPFNPSTTITYGLNNDSQVTVKIYDIIGKLITTLFNGEQTSGWHSVEWNGTNQNGEQIPAGLYFSKIKSDDNVKSLKLMLLK